MGIFDRFKRKRAKACTIWLSGDTEELISGYRRLDDCPEVVAAVNVYADVISSMTLHLMENGKNGDVRIRNALSALVDIEPNPYMTRKHFYSNIVRGLLLYGDGNQVTLPVFRDGLIERLVPLNPSKVRFSGVEGGYGDQYEIKYKNKTYMPEDVLHFRINPDPKKGWLGTGYAKLLAEAIVSMAQAVDTKKSILSQPTPSLIVKMDSTIEEMTTEEGREKHLGRFLKTRASGEPWFIPATLMDVEQIKPLTMKDLAIADNLALDKRQVAAVFGVPAFMVGIGEFKKDEYNNFIRSRVMSLAKAIEQELTRQLLIKKEWYFRFNPRSLMAYDIGEIVEAGAEMVDRTAMSRNELRDMIGMSPRDDMEELIILENYLPIDRIGDQKKLVGGNGDG